MRTVVFANYGTKERVASRIIVNDEISALQTLLNEKIGGNWVLVQDLGLGEIVRFEAVEEYRGFNGGDDYCGNLINLYELVK